MNFAEHLKSLYHTQRESDIHPHAPEERAELFSAIEPGSAELEVLTLLNALVYAYKPRNVLETGTGSGLTSIAIATALRANGPGRLHTVESDPNVAKLAEDNVSRYDPHLGAYICFHAADSREFIESWSGEPFDFAFFDSLIAFRHVEYELLLERELIRPGSMCAFHDTSRLRGECMHDFNPEMIEALDRHSQAGEWLELPYSRGFRLLRVPA